MSHQIDELILKIRALEEDLEVEFGKKRADFKFIMGEKRARFAEEVARQQRRLRTGILRYIIDTPLLNILVAPVIYAGIVPFIVMDLFLFIYQSVCFPVYGIPKVRRSDYMAFDREDLPYLNTIEKYGCFYCAYANGLAASSARPKASNDGTALRLIEICSPWPSTRRRCMISMSRPGS